MILVEPATRQAIDEAVRQRLSAKRINSVDVKSDYDSDGDPILRITVVFKANPSLHDARQIGPLIGDIRSRLKQSPEIGFPLISFVSKNEARKLQLAAA